MQHVLAWCGGIAFTLICLIIAAIFAARLYAAPYLERHIFVTHSPATATPETFGVTYNTDHFKSGPNTLMRRQHCVWHRKARLFNSDATMLRPRR